MFWLSQLEGLPAIYELHRACVMLTQQDVGVSCLMKKWAWVLEGAKCAFTSFTISFTDGRQPPSPQPTNRAHPKKFCKRVFLSGSAVMLMYGKWSANFFWFPLWRLEGAPRSLWKNIRASPLLPHYFSLANVSDLPYGGCKKRLLQCTMDFSKIHSDGVLFWKAL